MPLTADQLNELRERFARAQARDTPAHKRARELSFVYGTLKVEPEFRSLTMEAVAAVLRR